MSATVKDAQDKSLTPVGLNGIVSVAAIIVISAYIGVQMIADVASLKIVLLFGQSVVGGAFIYPLTFTLRDMVHKIAGARATRILIITAAVINLVMAALFWLVAQLPGDPAVGEQLFGTVLVPTGRIVIASIIAEVVSELIDTEVYRLWVERITTDYQWARVLVSNAVSVPIDSLLFVWLAFGGRLPAAVVWSILLSNMLIKGITTLISIPGIYLVRGE